MPRKCRRLCGLPVAVVPLSAPAPDTPTRTHAVERHRAREEVGAGLLVDRRAPALGAGGLIEGDDVREVGPVDRHEHAATVDRRASTAPSPRARAVHSSAPVSALAANTQPAFDATYRQPSAIDRRVVEVAVAARRRAPTRTYAGCQRLHRLRPDARPRWSWWRLFDRSCAVDAPLATAAAAAQPRRAPRPRWRPAARAGGECDERRARRSFVRAPIIMRPPMSGRVGDDEAVGHRRQAGRREAEADAGEHAVGGRTVTAAPAQRRALPVPVPSFIGRCSSGAPVDGVVRRRGSP